VTGRQFKVADSIAVSHDALKALPDYIDNPPFGGAALLYPQFADLVISGSSTAIATGRSMHGSTATVR
jgi:hypothetical protein